MNGRDTPLSREALLDGLPNVLTDQDRDLIYQNYVHGRQEPQYVAWVEGEKILLLGPTEDYATSTSFFDHNDLALGGLSPEEVLKDFDVQVVVYGRVEEAGASYYPVWMAGKSNDITRLQLRLMKGWHTEIGSRNN